ncbi:hypothetical protein CLV46_1921 [Diaminobutyricimonas aerilata]|uniref:Uncharacterized protein n=1 Tax=Diaminobutyricimonas aerilata TaxID=1162967 RepID=A0A2M9CKC4_9MICO|nr:hypothetical protein [Diaminobutyricimonas aerilata]PJJ72350.1 hypothetical protein CLV46_1921 [Diaminobutyricimonas aerilata]
MDITEYSHSLLSAALDREATVAAEAARVARERREARARERSPRRIALRARPAGGADC